jgi:hypothetical protein
LRQKRGHWVSLSPHLGKLCPKGFLRRWQCSHPYQAPLLAHLGWEKSKARG